MTVTYLKETVQPMEAWNVNVNIVLPVVDPLLLFALEKGERQWFNPLMHNVPKWSDIL